MDHLWLPYIGNSVITLTVLNIAIKACAKISPWNWDNAISDAFDEIIKLIFPTGRSK